jgi:hypothetical protein
MVSVMRSKRSCDLAYLKTGGTFSVVTGAVGVSKAFGAEEKALVAECVDRGRSPADTAARRTTLCEEEYILQECLTYCYHEVDELRIQLFLLKLRDFQHVSFHSSRHRHIRCNLLFGVNETRLCSANSMSVSFNFGTSELLVAMASKRASTILTCSAKSAASFDIGTLEM